MEHLVFTGFPQGPCPANASVQRVFELLRLRKGYEPVALGPIESKGSGLMSADAGRSSRMLGTRDSARLGFPIDSEQLIRLGFCASSRQNIRIGSEDILRIVLSLQSTQSFVVSSIGFAHPGNSLIFQHVDIGMRNVWV